MNIDFENHVIKLNRDIFLNFEKKFLQLSSHEILSIESFKSDDFMTKITQLGKQLFSDLIFKIKNFVEDENYGVAAVDIFEVIENDNDGKDLTCLAIAYALFSLLATPHRDRNTDLPFGFHLSKASDSETGKTIDFAYTLDSESRYHTDGISRQNDLYLPKLIGLYNVFLGFNKPGYVYWIPHEKIPELSFLAKNPALTKTIKINLPGARYILSSGEKFSAPDLEVSTPTIRSTPEEGNVFYINGNILKNLEFSDTALAIENLREKLNSSNHQIKVRRAERRLIFIKNIHGFHASDKMLEPIEELELRRVFVRFIDQAGPFMGDIRPIVE